MKPKLKKLNKKTEKVFKESDVAALLENMNDNIVILAEGQQTLREEMHRGMEELKQELRSEFKYEIGGLRAEMKAEVGGLRGEIKTEIGALRNEMKLEVGTLRSEMKEGFSLVMDHLKRIDGELVEIRKEFNDTKEEKVDWKTYTTLEKRLERAEKQIEELKVLFRVKKVPV